VRTRMIPIQEHDEYLWQRWTSLAMGDAIGSWASRSSIVHPGISLLTCEMLNRRLEVSPMVKQ